MKKAEFEESLLAATATYHIAEEVERRESLFYTPGGARVSVLLGNGPRLYDELAARQSAIMEALLKLPLGFPATPEHVELLCVENGVDVAGADFVIDLRGPSIGTLS